MVLGPDQVPVVIDPEVARQNPELAVLSVLTRWGMKNPAPVLRALVTGALDEFDHEHAQLYTDLIATVLPAAAKACLEDIMSTAAREHTSEFAIGYLPKTFARGRAAGIAEGKAEGKADAVVAILESRSIPITDDVRERITACADIEQLDVWIRRAVTAAEVHELFL